MGTAEREIFSLESTGSTVALKLQRPLDRELMDSYSLRLQATDRGTPPLVGETIVNITVLVSMECLGTMHAGQESYRDRFLYVVSYKVFMHG